MARFAKAERERIVREFTVRHNGLFDPGLFLGEVRAGGADHPAHGWFEWDEEKAAHQFRLEQARDFARDIKVSFTVEAVGRDKAVRVVAADAPLVFSPVSGRRHGGGYTLTDPGDPAHIGELCRQAATDLEAWLRRYSGALASAGVTSASFDRPILLLRAAAEGGKPKAA